MYVRQFQAIAMFLVTSPIVINVPTRGLLAVETIHAIVQWLANLNIKRNMTSMFVNKKHRYFVLLVRNCLASMLDYIVMQMRTINREKGYSPAIDALHQWRLNLNNNNL